MLTVREVLGDLDVRLLAGEDNLDVPIRWVHISELADPTPWMSGGELLLTTGLRLKDEPEQREYVRRLVDPHLAGLGFGTGLDHDDIRSPVREEAEPLGLSLFEVDFLFNDTATTEKA